MRIEQIFLEILGKESLSLDDIRLLLSKIGVKVKFSECRVLLYKEIEKILLCYYKETYGINLFPKIYSVDEINGLILFLYIKKYNSPAVGPELEAFFERLFFSEADKTHIEELKKENARLEAVTKELREKLNDANNLLMDKELEDVDSKGVEREVLSKMEDELIDLRKRLDFENSMILEAWYKLAEEYIKNK